MSHKPQAGAPVIALAALLGVTAAVSVLPRTRNTALTQVALTLGHHPEWLRATYVSLDGKAEPGIERTLVAHPDDLQLQVGAATLKPSPQLDPGYPDGGSPSRQANVRHILGRLDELARRFPNEPSIRAHQLRYQSVAAALIWRPEEQSVFGKGSPATIVERFGQRHPSEVALREFRETAIAGGELEPSNGFFDAMQMVAAFGARRDAEALRLLHAAAWKLEWNDYLQEEIRSQWVLQQAAYGTRGWLQKLPAGIAEMPAVRSLATLSSVEQAARVALWHAWQREKAGDPAGVQMIRADVMRLGLLICSNSSKEEGQICGLSLFEEGCGPIPLDNPLGWNLSDLEAHRHASRSGYLNYLKRNGMVTAAAQVELEARQADASRHRIDQARSEHQAVQANGASVWLGPGWATGMLLLKQIATLLLLWAIVSGLSRRSSPHTPPSGTGIGGWIAACLLVYLAPFAALANLGNEDGWPGSLEAGAVAAVLVAGSAIWLLLRLRTQQGNKGGWRLALAWLVGYLMVFLAPLVLVIQLAPIHLLWACLASTILIGMLTLARASGPPASTGETPLRWRPVLVALISILPIGLMFAVGLRSGRAMADVTYLLLVLQSFPPGFDVGKWRNVVALFILLPAALLLFMQLCRAAALRQPLPSGLLRGLRQTIPYALALLLILYLAALVPTVAAERAVEAELVRMVQAPGAGSQ